MVHVERDSGCDRRGIDQQITLPVGCHITQLVMLELVVVAIIMLNHVLSMVEFNAVVVADRIHDELCCIVTGAE